MKNKKALAAPERRSTGRLGRRGRGPEPSARRAVYAVVVGAQAEMRKREGGGLPLLSRVPEGCSVVDSRGPVAVALCGPSLSPNWKGRAYLGLFRRAA